jgi:hypothetical protein
MISTIEFSYGIGTVGSIISQLFDFKDQEIQKIRVINHYMHKHNFDIQFQNKYYQICYGGIRENLKYMWRC